MFFDHVCSRINTYIILLLISFFFDTYFICEVITFKLSCTGRLNIVGKKFAKSKIFVLIVRMIVNPVRLKFASVIMIFEKRFGNGTMFFWKARKQTGITSHVMINRIRTRILEKNLKMRK